MLHKKTILLFTDWYEPGYKAGGPIQSCKNIVNSLSGRYNFYVLTSDRDLGDVDAYQGIAFDRWTPLGNGALVWYASQKAMNAAIVKQIIIEISPDVVYLNSMFSLKFALLPLWVMMKMDFKGKIVLAPRGMLHKGALSRKGLKKKMFLTLASCSQAFRRIHFHATDAKEQSDIKRYFPRARSISIAENIPNSDQAVWIPRQKQAAHLNCIFVSRIHPKKNLHFALQTLQEVKSDQFIRFDVYGAIDDKTYYEQCVKIAGQMKGNVRVNFMGPIPNSELFGLLRQYHLFFLPTLGENFGHAIFEAMSSGCPVLISDQTPWDKLTINCAGWAFPLSSKGEYVRTIEEVSGMSADEFNKMSLSAYQYAHAYLFEFAGSEKYIELF